MDKKCGYEMCQCAGSTNVVAVTTAKTQRARRKSKFIATASTRPAHSIKSKHLRLVRPGLQPQPHSVQDYTRFR